MPNPASIEMNDDKPEEGLKYDGGKLLFSCLTRGCARALQSVAAVLTYGAKKYKADSWQNVPDAKRRYEDALDRHLNDWKRGEQFDKESGLPHLAHIATNALFLLEFEIKDHFNLPQPAKGRNPFIEFNNPKGPSNE